MNCMKNDHEMILYAGQYITTCKDVHFDVSSLVFILRNGLATIEYIYDWPCFYLLLH